MNDISVIIPAYNAARFLPEAVSSLCHQSELPCEVVIVNDASEDDTREVVVRMKKRFARLPIVYDENSANLGGGATRNRCVHLSKGEYIFCLDADNLLIPGTLHRFLGRAFQVRKEQDRHCMVAAEILQYFRDRFPLPHWARLRPVRRFCRRWGLKLGRKLCDRWYFHDVSYEYVMTNPCSPASSGNYLYHREIFEKAGGYPEDCGAYDAWAFAARSYVAGYRFEILPGLGYLHRLHEDSYWTRQFIRGNEVDSLKRTFRHLQNCYTEDTLTYIEGITHVGDFDWSRLRLRDQPGYFT